MTTHGPTAMTQAPNAPTMPPLCISVTKTAGLLGVSPRQVYNLAAKAGLPTVKLGGRRLVRTEDLKHWLANLPVADAGQECEAQGGAGGPHE